ncbi:S-adenosyl-L-methionine-dependent methyltransferase [Polyporus arcularius HHB13444]|uniref:S-adenosyl-L-methionine-dependent methyltransferase n=1 Tax=Polyporus arcularius HHB13444 TaxID=1314778 RepID=A0A5C3PDU1_9APHY|nr:S-adenosyl-L-methionine-dependent methyltransferase [Polyporus arcularius HHB13444]
MSTSTPQDLNAATTQWYNTNPELEDGRLRAHRIEFEVTLRTIISRLPDRPGLKILDIGGGAGPYTFALAARGHAVTLVDLSEGLLDLARTRASALPPSSRPARILQGDATALSSIPELAFERGTFDAVLLLGPLYHIMSAPLREAAIQHAWSMVRSEGGGALFCAFVSRWAHYRALALTDPTRLAARREFYAQHARDGEYVRLNEGGVPCHAMHHELPAEMPRILQRVTGVRGENVEMLGTEGLLVGGLCKAVNELQGDDFEAWVEKCMEVGADDHGWMLADHIVGIVSKA